MLHFSALNICLAPSDTPLQHLFTGTQYFPCLYMSGVCNSITLCNPYFISMQVHSRKKWPDAPQPATNFLERHRVHIVTNRDLLEFVVFQRIDDLRN
jgi:hypothetical protein